MKGPRGGALGIFPHLGAAVHAARELRRSGFEDCALLSPVPGTELMEELQSRTSPVRVWTLAGGLLGCACGFALTIGTALDLPLRTGGKPILALPAFAVIAFELTILVAALATVAGFFLHSRLPRFGAPAAYDPQFSDDGFGVLVRCAHDRRQLALESLKTLGAWEVRVEMD